MAKKSCNWSAIGESELELAEIRDDISENYKDFIKPIHYNFYKQPLKNAVCCERS